MSDDFDLSDEALAAAAGAVETPAEPEAGAEVQEAPEAAEESTEAIENEPQAAAETEPEEIIDPRDKKIAELEKVLGRQGQELGEYRKQQEAWAEQQRQAQYAQSPDVLEKILDNAPTNPDKAFEVALQAVNEGYASPEFIDDLIDELHEAGEDRAARRLDRQWVKIQAQAELAPVQESYAQQTFMSEFTNASNALLQARPEAQEFAQDIAALVLENPQLLGDGSPEAMRFGMEAAYGQVLAANPQRLVELMQKRAQQQAQYAQSADLATTSAVTPDPSAAKSETDKLVEEMFSVKTGVDQFFS